MPVPKPTRQVAEPLPVWAAALQASPCHVMARAATRRVDWQFDSGRALYTNVGQDLEFLVPFGVEIPSGETVSVTWTPGDTGYTVELVEDDDPAAA